MEKLDGKTLDVVQENIEKLKQLFPEVFTEDKINFEKLQLTLGEHIETERERYEFTWNGKTEAIQMAQKQSTATLRPCKEESVDWDTTQNLYIEGDNLEVLRLLQNSYRNKVKMIYIDPPYNTGRDFVYKDNFHDNVKNYKEMMDESYKSNPETNGRYHTDWLNMIYPRLILAKSLLRNDGVIFISIDDNEVSNLRKVCDEVFGESNFIAQLPTVMNLKGNNDQYGFAGTHEYTLVFTKNRQSTTLSHLPVSDDEMKEWEMDDMGYFKKGANLKATGVNAPRNKRPNLFFPIYITEDLELSLTRESVDDTEIFPMTDNKEMSWRWSKEKFLNEPHNIIVIKNGNNFSIYKKTRPFSGDQPTVKPKTLFYKPEYSSGNGTNQIKELFDEKVFSNPKPLDLIKDFILIGIGDEKEGIVLDFFAGSGTTSHAVFEIQNEHSLNDLKFISVQLPEKINEGNEASQLLGTLGMPQNLSEITKERIRRAAKSIKNSDNVNLAGDFGFKVFKLDETNLKIWDEEVEDIESELLFFEGAVKEGRSKVDVLYEILLKYGIDLTVPIEEEKVDDVTAFSVGMGYLVVCLDKNLSVNDIEQLVSTYTDCERMVFLDNGFASDEVKINAEQILKRNGVKDIRVI